jgi:hypothetical protein
LNEKPQTNPWKIGLFITSILWILSILGLTYFFKFNKLCETKYPPLEKVPVLSPFLAPNVLSPIPTIASVKEKITLPVIVYEPSGLFNAGDKEQLSNKIINPFFDYNNEKEINFIAMVVSKKPSEEYEYSFMAIHKDGGYQSSVIVKQNGVFGYWFPECMGPCEFSQSYKEKYPEVVKRANP